MLRKLLGSEHRPWQAKQARLSHCPQKVNYTDNSTKQREEINPLWPYWKEESIKRCNERRPTQSSAGLAMMFTLWVCLYLLIWLVILLVTGEGITCYQTCRKSQVKLLESVFFSHLGSRIQVKSSAWWEEPLPTEPSCQLQGLHFNSRQALYVNKQSHSLGGHCPSLFPLQFLLQGSLERYQNCVKSLLGRQIPPLGGTSLQLFPSLGMGFLKKVLRTTASIIW